MKLWQIKSLPPRLTVIIVLVLTEFDFPASHILLKVTLRQVLPAVPLVTNFFVDFCLACAKPDISSNLVFKLLLANVTLTIAGLPAVAVLGPDHAQLLAYRWFVIAADYGAQQYNKKKQWLTNNAVPLDKMEICVLIGTWTVEAVNLSCREWHRPQWNPQLTAHKDVLLLVDLCKCKFVNLDWQLQTMRLGFAPLVHHSQLREVKSSGTSSRQERKYVCYASRQVPHRPDALPASCPVCYGHYSW